MTITLAFRPEIEAGLLAKAHTMGMALQEYLQAIVEEEAFPSSEGVVLPEPARREEAVRRMLEFGDLYHLSLDESVTREVLHERHRI